MVKLDSQKMVSRQSVPGAKHLDLRSNVALRTTLFKRLRGYKFSIWYKSLSELSLGDYIHHADLTGSWRRPQNFTNSSYSYNSTPSFAGCRHYTNGQADHQSTRRQVVPRRTCRYSVWSYRLPWALHCQSTGSTGMYGDCTLQGRDGKAAFEGHRRLGQSHLHGV
jgi:hypothetical protein